VETIDIQIIGNYGIGTEALDEGGYSTFITHPYTIKNQELDNKILDGSMVNGNLHLFRKGKPMLIYSAFPIELLELPYQIYIMDTDSTGEAILAIKVDMGT